MGKRTMLKGKFVIGYLDGQHVIYEDGEVVYEDDAILYVGNNYEGRIDEVWETGSSIISPGFIDLEADVDTDHANFDVVLFKKNPGDQKEWTPGAKYRTVDPYTDEEFSVRQKYSMAQLIMNGITTIMPIEGEQFHGWSQSYHEFEIMAESARLMGLRAYLGPSFKSSPDRNMPYDQSRADRSYDDAIKYFHNYDDTNCGMIRGFMNPCQIAVTDPKTLCRAKAFAQETKSPMRLHACEEDIEWKYMLPKYGKTTIDYFQDLGLLCPELLIPHAITLKDSEIKKLGDSGVSVIQTPVAEINYGAALNSFAKYQALGVNIAFGTDCQPTDMIQNMRLAWDLDRLCEWHMFFNKYEEDGRMIDLLEYEKDYPKTSAVDFFNGATTNAAKALGREDIGRLAHGAKADIIVVDLDDLRVGPYEDPLRTLLVSCVGNNVRHTIINGKVRMKDWKLVDVDEEDLKKKAQIVYEKYLGLFQEYDAESRPLSTFCPPSLRIIKKQDKI